MGSWESERRADKCANVGGGFDGILLFDVHFKPSSRVARYWKRNYIGYNQTAGRAL